MEEREPIIRLSENETQICADCPGCSISQILRVKVRDGSLAISQAYEFDRSVPLSSTSLPQVVDALYEGIIVARSYASLSGESYIFVTLVVEGALRVKTYRCGGLPTGRAANFHNKRTVNEPMAAALRRIRTHKIRHGG